MSYNLTQFGNVGERVKPPRTGYSAREEILIAHGFLGGLLAMIVWPLSAVTARLLRTYWPNWLRLHYWLAGILAIPMVIITFALGRRHKQGDHDNWTTPHFRLGLILLLLGILQPLYGWLIHAMKPRHEGTKSLLRYGHPLIGFTIVVLGFYEVYTGFEQWRNPGTVSHGIYIAWGVTTGMWLVIYIAGLGLLPRQWRQRKEAEAAIRASKTQQNAKGRLVGLVSGDVEKAKCLRA